MPAAVEAIAYFVKDVSAFASLVLVLRYVFLDRLKGKKIILPVMLVLFALTASGHLFLRKVEDYDSIIDFISNILYILGAYFISSERRFMRTVWIVMLEICTVDTFWPLLSPVLPAGLVTEYAVNTAFYLIIIALIYYFAVKSGINALPQIFDEIPRWVFGLILFFEFTCYYKEFGFSPPYFDIVYSVLSVTVVICVLCLIFRLFYLNHRQNEVLKELAEQLEYGEKSLNGDEELRRFRHDYKNHMIVVNSLLSSGKTEEAREYLSSISEGISGAVSKIITGNMVADALVNNKLSSAAQNNIIIRFNGAVPKEGIRNEDLSTVLSNLLDNAVEAAAAVEGERVIRIKAGEVNGFFILSISNPCVKAPEASDGVFKTSKSDKTSHGFGIKNVLRAVKKYNGDMQTDFSDGVFTVDVRMKLKSE